jgi:DNA-binding transcriptional ArsR family regulator
VDKIFKALTDINRRKILTLLKNGELNVSKIVEKLDIGQPTVSSHLAVLRKAGLVEVTVKSKERIYKLNRVRLNSFVKELNRFIEWTEVNVDDEIILRRKV